MPDLRSADVTDIKRCCLSRLMQVLCSADCPPNAMAALSREACRLADELQAFDEPLAGLLEPSADPVGNDVDDVV